MVEEEKRGLLTFYSALVEDLNGPHAFKDERAAFGYVQRHEYLRVVAPLLNACPTDLTPGTAELGNLNFILATAYFNAARLREGNVNDAVAVRIGLLRAKWISLGWLRKTKEQRNTPFNEVMEVVGDRIVGPIGADFSVEVGEDYNVVTYDETKWWSDELKKVDVNKWSELAPILWAVVAHVFRVRGHHYKLEYEELYTRTFAGTLMTFPDNILTWQDIGRTAIHPFGVSALERGAAEMEANNSLPRNLLIRRNAIPCGAALVGTTYAALKSLAGTPFYPQIRAHYTVQIDALELEYQEVITHGLAYHISAGLYGIQKRVLNTVSAEALAPLLGGYIDALPRESAIKGQKSLNKHKDTNPLMSKLFSTWLQGQVDSAGKAKRMEDALMLPDIEEDEKE